MRVAPANATARDRTRQRILAAAVALVGRGRVPSIAEVALRADVSRATAYRYFPSRSKLIAAVVAASLEPVRRYEPRAADPRHRLRELFTQTFPRFRKYEPHMRAALQLSLEHESLARAGLLEEEPYRRGFRRDLLYRAAAPFRRDFGGKDFDRLVKALSLFYGIEPYVVLKDIWDCSDAEVESILRWSLEALLDAALRQNRTRLVPRAPMGTQEQPKTSSSKGAAGRRR
jgi:AcrR family transcriptional regulator